MCDHCGCGAESSGYSLVRPDHDHADSDSDSHSHTHSHSDSHSHTHSHSDSHSHLHAHAHTHAHQNPNQNQNQNQNPTKHRISIETDVLQQNNLLAQRNRGYFEAKDILALNLVSSPGSGKTTLLERTISELRGQRIYVIEGDQQTALDAERIHATGIPVMQINTGSGCHLDAKMVYAAVKALQPENKALLIIENVGNLVCPALFDLGEKYRVVIISVTEGHDKPLKYPDMFRTSGLCLINKTDLLPYVDFDLESFKANALKVNPDLKFIALSAKTGEGLTIWTQWITDTRHLPKI
jgi:hydrogenase nickel incorporation protein HypB